MREEIGDVDDADGIWDVSPLLGRQRERHVFVFGDRFENNRERPVIAAGLVSVLAVERNRLTFDATLG